MFHITLFLIAIANAATPVPGVFEKSERLDRDDTPQPIEELRSKLLKRSRSKVAKKISRATAALRAKKFAEARSLVAGLQRDELFSDYYYGIQALSHRQEALQNVLQSRAEGAIRNAKRAIDLTWDIESRYPYSSFLKRVPETLADSELSIADSQAIQGQWVAAQSTYERAFQRMQLSNTLGNVRVESIGRYAESCSKKAGTLCRAWIQRFAQLSPKFSEEAKALAKFFPDVLDRPRPPGVTRQTQKYKGGDLDQQAFDATMQLYAEGKYSQAIKAYHRFLDEFPRSQHRHRARYWMGQALSQEQEHEKAQRTYEDLLRETPLSYYGLLAAVATGKSTDAEIAGTLPQALPTDPFLLPQEVFRLKRAERFLAEGAPELARQELRDLRTRDALSGPYLIYLATLHHEAGNHVGTFPILSDLIQRSYSGVYSSYVVRLIFPVVFWDLIQKNSAAVKLDPILILSLMKQESAFDDDVASSVGATGLMQLMPATAVETEPGVRRADLIIPETNIRIGTKYLKKMLDKYNGNIAYALAAYNAGPGAVDRWIRDGRSRRGLLDFIEQIPYRETRDYVGSIIRNYYWYSKRLNGDIPKSLAFFWSTYGPSDVTPPVPAPAAADATAVQQANAPAEEETTTN